VGLLHQLALQVLASPPMPTFLSQSWISVLSLLDHCVTCSQVLGWPQGGQLSRTAEMAKLPGLSRPSSSPISHTSQ
jgi:hypothetical protein